MIIKEFYLTRDDGISLYKTYSDNGYYILQNETGTKYSEAIDVETSTYTYTETDEYIDGNEEITGDEFLAMVEGVL